MPSVGWAPFSLGGYFLDRMSGPAGLAICKADQAVGGVCLARGEVGSALIDLMNGTHVFALVVVSGAAASQSFSSCSG